MTRRISATKAAREFSDILDRVEHAGEEFVVERHGRVVATISPATPGGRTHVTIGDLLHALEGTPIPDATFIADMKAKPLHEEAKRALRAG